MELITIIIPLQSPSNDFALIVVCRKNVWNILIILFCSKNNGIYMWYTQTKKSDHLQRVELIGESSSFFQSAFSFYFCNQILKRAYRTLVQLPLDKLFLSANTARLKQACKINIFLWVCKHFFIKFEFLRLHLSFM